MLISPARNDTIELTSEQVKNEAMEVVGTQFEMEINGYKYTSNEILDTLLYASASGKTINYAPLALFCDFISDEVKKKYGFRSSIKL